jgi:uncharacterized membrane protein
MSTEIHAASHTMSDEELAERIVLDAWEQERRRNRKPIPRWVRPAMRALPRLLGIVTLSNGLIGLLAVIAPFLRIALGTSVTAPLYSAYAFICPQRPSHTWFIAGEPMAMEQRMVAMYLAFGIAGLLYLIWSRMRQPLPTWMLIVAVAPVLIDVAISTAGIRHSTAASRLWTGSLASLAIVWWSYPRFEGQLRLVQERVARMRELQAR